MTPAEKARHELEAQKQSGEWSGLVSSDGGPVYTLKEIAAAVVRELGKRKTIDVVVPKMKPDE